MSEHVFSENIGVSQCYYEVTILLEYGKWYDVPGQQSTKELAFTNAVIEGYHLHKTNVRSSCGRNSEWSRSHGLRCDQ